MVNHTGGNSAQKTIELKPTEFIGHYIKEIPTGNGLHLIKAGTGCGKTTFMTSVYESNRKSIIVFPTKAIAEQVKLEIKERDKNNPHDVLGLERVVQLEHFPTHSIEDGVPVLFDEVQLFKEQGAFRSIFGVVGERIKELAKTNPVYIVSGTWTDHLSAVFPISSVVDFQKKFNRKVGFIELKAITANDELNGGNLAIYTRSLADIIIKIAIWFADSPSMFYLESREKLRVISDILTEAGLSNIVVTSCKDQPEAVKRWFKSGNIRDCGVDVVLCTSVVAEGINVRDGANIICMPDAPERLVQRFGRNRIDPITGECAGRYFLIGSPDMIPMPKVFSFENPDVGSLKQVADGFSAIENDEHRKIANEFKRYQEMCRESRFAQYIWAYELPKFGYNPDFDLVMEHVRDSKDQAGKSIRMRTAVITGLEMLTTAFYNEDEMLTTDFHRKHETEIGFTKKMLEENKLDEIMTNQEVNKLYKHAFSSSCATGKDFRFEFAVELVNRSGVLFETAYKRVREIENMFDIFNRGEDSEDNRKLKALPLEFLMKLDKEARDWCSLYNSAGRDAQFKRDREVNNMAFLADFAISLFEEEFKDMKSIELTKAEIAAIAYEVFSRALNGNMPDKWKMPIKVVSDQKDEGEYEKIDNSMVNLFALLIGAERKRLGDNSYVWRYNRSSKWWCDIPNDLKKKHYNFIQAAKKAGRETDLKVYCERLKRTPIELLSDFSDENIERMTPAKIFKAYDKTFEVAQAVIQETVKQEPKIEVDWGV